MEIWRLLQRSIDFIEQHLSSKMTVQQMAEQAYLSSFYFQRLFKGMIGITPAAYVNLRRLSKAIERVTFTSEPISAIGAALGFENHETFSRAFKGQFGVSPSKQRKERYCLPRYCKPNLAAGYDFNGINVPVTSGGIVFTLRLWDQEFLRHFPSRRRGEPDRELAEVDAPQDFCGRTLTVGRYVVCSVEAENEAALRSAMQTAKKHLYTVWAPDNRAALSYPGFELYHGLLPDGAAHGELWIKLRYWRGELPMENNYLSCSRITLDREIYITGLNLQASGLPITFDSLPKMWDKKAVFTEEIRDGIQNTVYPVVEYAVSLNRVPDYIVGREVASAGSQGKPYYHHTVPAGEYVKVAFHGDTFVDMVENRIEPAMKAGKAWAKQNHLKLDNAFSLEVYPHETTMTDFPEMYLLFPIKTE